MTIQNALGDGLRSRLGGSGSLLAIDIMRTISECVANLLASHNIPERELTLSYISPARIEIGRL